MSVIFIVIIIFPVCEGIAKNVYRKFVNYGTGYVTLWGPAAAKKDDKFTMDHITIFPRNEFLKVFSQPLLMANKLEEKGRELGEEYKLMNEKLGGAKMPTPCERTFTIFEQTFENNMEKPKRHERSVFELGLNTWGFSFHQGATDREALVGNEHIKVEGVLFFSVSDLKI
jgi:hypothetical protein